jgi:hypothetical protein
MIRSCPVAPTDEPRAVLTTQVASPRLADAEGQVPVKNSLTTERLTGSEAEANDVLM